MARGSDVTLRPRASGSGVTLPPLPPLSYKLQTTNLIPPQKHRRLLPKLPGQLRRCRLNLYLLLLLLFAFTQEFLHIH